LGKIKRVYWDWKQIKTK